MLRRLFPVTPPGFFFLKYFQELLHEFIKPLPFPGIRPRLSSGFSPENSSEISSGVSARVSPGITITILSRSTPGICAEISSGYF